MVEFKIECFDKDGKLKSAFKRERKNLPTGGAEIKKYSRKTKTSKWVEQ